MKFLLIWLVTSCKVIIIEDPDIEDGVVSAQAKVENGAKTDGLHGKVVLIGSCEWHL